MTDYLVGVDLGGTRMRAALFDDDLQMIHRHEKPTNAKRGRDDTLRRMLELVRGILPDGAGSQVRGIGISAPGPSNPKTGVLVAPPNLPGWHNVPLEQILRDEFGYKAYLGNDANVAALAETARGAGRGYRHVIFVTISTGIGGGIISDGRMLLGKDGLAAEVGHMSLVIGDSVTTLEKEAAGPALIRKARVRIEAGEPSIIIELANGDLDKISGHIIGSAAEQGDPLALSVVKRAGWIVGLGMVSLLHVFNPEIIVIGGGVSNLGDLLFAPMHEAIEQYCIDPSYWRDLKVKSPELGENVSLVGAAALVLTRGGMEDVAALTRKLDEA